MHSNRLSRRSLIAAGLLTSVARAQAPAADFPARPVRLIVPAPPGGVQDIRSRPIRAGRLKGLAVAAERRAAILPELPTFAEQGYAGMEVTGWQGLVVPAGTPDAVVRTIHRAALRALEAPDLRDAIVASGAEVGSGSPEAFGALIRAEHARWGRLIAKAGIRLE